MASFLSPDMSQVQVLDQLTTEQHLILLRVTNPPSEVSKVWAEIQALIGSHSEEQHIQWQTHTTTEIGEVRGRLVTGWVYHITLNRENS